MKSRKTATILVVDDDEMWLELMTICLQESGHIVLSASTSHKTKELLTANHFDIAIVDWHLNDMSVATFLKMAKELQSSMKVVLFSGSLLDSHQEEMLLDRYHIDGYFAKGKPLDELSQKVLNLLEIPAKQ